MKTEIELIEYLNKKGWSIPMNQLHLAFACYNIGFYDAKAENQESNSPQCPTVCEEKKEGGAYTESSQPTSEYGEPKQLDGDGISPLFANQKETAEVKE